MIVMNFVMSAVFVYCKWTLRVNQIDELWFFVTFSHPPTCVT